MPERASVEEALARIKSCVKPPLIAIDGLPCAGKSTIAGCLREHVDLTCICVDDFVLFDRDGSPAIEPAFPFPYVRYDEFLSAVQALHATGACSYRPFDWDLFQVSAEQRIVDRSKPVIVEGVSSLNEALCPLYELRIFVESDRATALQSVLQRGSGFWSNQWREVFMPSVDIYMQTEPEKRADLLIAGRGRGPPPYRGEAR